METRLFLVAAPGLEAACAKEAARVLPGAECTITTGGVELVGDDTLIAHANLALRLPTRILLRLGELEARDFGKLEKRAAALPWARYLPAGAPVTIRAASAKSRLYHTGAIEERVALALAGSVGAVLTKPADPTDDDDTSAHAILVRGLHDRYTFSLDTSGARLHQRGWRMEGGLAPLRETLAAALVALAEHADDEPLVDPMCGSGTIAIEAALLQIRRAPGQGRSFAFERFVGFDAARLGALRVQLKKAERARRLPIVLADADAAQLAIARRNAVRAGVDELVTFELGPLAQRKPHAERGLFITNPPYGRRIGTRSAMPPLYGEIGRALKGAYTAWRAAILVEDRALLPALGIDEARTIALSNGGLKVWIARREPSLPKPSLPSPSLPKR